MRIYFRFGGTWLKYAPPNFTRLRARQNRQRSHRGVLVLDHVVWAYYP